MSPARHSLWKRFSESVKRGDVLERIVAQFSYTSEKEIEPILKALLGKLQQPVIFEFGVHHGKECHKLCSWLTEPFSAYYAWEPDPRNAAGLE